MRSNILFFDIELFIFPFHLELVFNKTFSMTIGKVCFKNSMIIDPLVLFEVMTFLVQTNRNP